MKEEIAAAVLFIAKLVQRGGHMPDCYLGRFQQRLGQLLEQRFSNHWHPERPWRGQAYRCLRVNETQRREPTIEQAAKDCGLLYTDLKLPVELTIWVDPEEVCCRFGEAKGSCCVVASFKEGNKENYIDNFDFSSISRPSASPSPTSKSGDILQDKTGECINTSEATMTATTNTMNVAPNSSPLSANSPTSSTPSSCSTSSPPSSTQSTPTKRKAFSPHNNNKTSPNHNKLHHNNNKRNYGNNHHHHNGYNNHHHHHHHHPPPHHHSNGSYSPPYFKSNHQSWVNLSQTPPPPHVPLFSSGAGFIYPPAAPPHYTASAPHSAHHFTRSPPNVGPQKLKWNAGSSYPRQDRHPWFSHRALARV
ncbi:unnamed protein product [Meganyctiphanes norvegica]|uniref:Anti-proliferative protein domain-containing protein n=1 Tax=Meganyctiphanes norvegica TaxID=48144 RepID=A0AAV2R2B0_MEGNR